MVYSPPKGGIKSAEVFVFEVKTDNSTAASGVTNHTINITPGAFDIGITISTSGADQDAIAKVWAFQNVAQSTSAAGLSEALYIFPHSAVAAVTLLTAAATTTYGGSSGQVYFGTTNTTGAGSVGAVMYPYGLLFQTTCDTDSGNYTYKVVAQQRT